MIFLLYLIPVFALISAVALYRHNGKLEVLKMDLVQFFYAFVLVPVMYIWLKSFLFYLLQTELTVRLSQTRIFLIDTIFSTIFLYFFAFVVLHSLTKTFNLKRMKDPLYNLFEHAEFFHLWASHLVMYGGVLVMLLVLSLVNVFFPIKNELTDVLFYLLTASGLASGALLMVVIELTDLKHKPDLFNRVMKLAVGVAFLLHVVVYFMFSPAFSPAHGFFWWVFTMLTSFIAATFFVQRSVRAQNIFERIEWYIKSHTLQR